MKGKKRARGDASMIQHSRGGCGGGASGAFLPTDASTVARVAAAAEKALLLTVQSGLLVSWVEASQLQRASLALCAVCRRCVPVRVRVTANTPRAAWACGNGDRGVQVGVGGRKCGNGTGDNCNQASGRASHDTDTKKAKRRRRKQERQQREHQHPPRHQQRAGKAECRGGGGVNSNGSSSDGADGARRLPRLQISSMLWEAPASHLGDGSDLPSELRELTFGRDFNRTLSGLAWPPKLERLAFGSRFNRDLAQSKDRSGVGQATAATCAVVAGGGDVGQEEKSETALRCLLPMSLKELTFGKQFNKPLPRRLLPPGLVSLTLGRNFRHRGSVRDVVWPAGVKVVRFGEAMLKRERRDWPRLEAMRGLISSSDYPNGAAAPAEFAWPAGLERVEFWQEGKAVVSLNGGKTLGGDSLEWLTNH